MPKFTYIITKRATYFLAVDSKANSNQPFSLTFTGVPSLNWQMGDGNTVYGADRVTNYTYPANLDGQIKRIRLFGAKTSIAGVNFTGANLVGLLDMRELEGISGTVWADNNELSGVLFPETTNYLGSVKFNNNKLTTADCSPLKGGALQYEFQNNLTLAEFISADSDTLAFYNLQFTALNTPLIIKTKVSRLELRNQTTLPSIQFTRTQSEACADFFLYGVLNQPIIDLSGFQGGFTGSFYVVGNANNQSVQQLLLPAGPATTLGIVNITNLRALAALDFKSLKFSATLVLLNTNGLTSFNIDSTNNRPSSLRLDSNKLNQTYGFGTKLLPTAIRLENNLHSVANVDANIADIYANRALWNAGAKSLNIGGSGNGKPTGVEQAPFGFVQGSNDGTPANAREMIYVLKNNYSWAITYNV